MICPRSGNIDHSVSDAPHLHCTCRTEDHCVLLLLLVLELEVAQQRQLLLCHADDCKQSAFLFLRCVGMQLYLMGLVFVSLVESY